jgi:hypothetical protein
MDLNKTETLLKFFHEISPINFCVTCSLSSSYTLDVSQFENNLKKLILKQPYINLTLHNKKIFEPPYYDLLILNTDQSLQEVQNKALTESLQAITAIIKGNKVSFVFQHYIADGRSSFAFINQLFEQIQGIQDKNEQPIFKKTRNRYNSIFQHLYLLQWCFSFISQWLQYGMNRPSPVYNKSSSSHELSIKRHVFSRDESKKIISYCKKNNISVTALLNAAMSHAMKKHLYHNQQNAISTFLAVDMKSNPTKKLKADISFITIKNNLKSQSLIETSSASNSKIKKAIHDDNHHALFKTYPPKSTLSKFIVRSIMRLDQHTCILTNIGMLNQIVSKETTSIIDHLDLYVPPGIESPFSFSSWTYKETLCITATAFSARLKEKILLQCLEDTATSIIENTHV